MLMPSTKSKEIQSNVFRISDYLVEKQIVFLQENSKDSVLFELVNVLDKEQLLKDKHEFYHLILARESIVSTGIGMGVAVPHAKTSHYENFFVAVGIHSQGIVWDAIDGALVRLVFMIGGPENKQATYLQLLSKLTSVLKEDERRKRLLGVKKAEDVVKLFSGI